MRRQYLDSVLGPGARPQVTGEGTGKYGGFPQMHLCINQTLSEVVHGAWRDTKSPKPSLLFPGLN